MGVRSFKERWVWEQASPGLSLCYFVRTTVETGKCTISKYIPKMTELSVPTQRKRPPGTKLKFYLCSEENSATRREKSIFKSHVINISFLTQCSLGRGSIIPGGGGAPSPTTFPYPRTCLSPQASTRGANVASSSEIRSYIGHGQGRTQPLPQSPLGDVPPPPKRGLESRSKPSQTCHLSFLGESEL